MKQILSRLKCPEIEIKEMWKCLDSHWSVTFLINQTWPIVDALICFYSEGFPYLMARQYVQKYKPLLINSLEKQQLLWDRTIVYDILKKIKVPVAKHYYVFRDKNYFYDMEIRGNGKIIDPPSTHCNLLLIQKQIPKLDQKKLPQNIKISQKKKKVDILNRDIDTAFFNNK